MMQSLELHSKEKVYWNILALDHETHNLLESLKKPNLRIWLERDISSVDLFDLKLKRTYVEYCWSLASILLDFQIKNSIYQSQLVYVDADIFFYGDINKSLEVLKEGNIAIHEHRFSSKPEVNAKKVGRFNVGIIAGNYSIEFNKCIEEWKLKVIDECVLDTNSGKCGDQHYLNDWPDKFSGLRIMKSNGDGAGVWNLKNTKLHLESDKIFLDQDELIFFHFHGLKIYFLSKALTIFSPSPGYGIKKEYFPIYKAYLQSLVKIRSNFDFIQFNRKKLRIPMLLKHYLQRELGIFINL